MIVQPDAPRPLPPVPEGVKPVGVDELNALIQRMKVAHDKMGAKNANRALLVECSTWLKMLTAKVMRLQAQASASEPTIVRPF